MASGAILSLPSFAAQAVASAQQTFTWQLANAFGPNSFFNPAINPNGFIIPSGVSLVEVFFVSAGTLSNSSTDPQVTIKKNGTEFITQLQDNASALAFGFSSGIIPVTAGDIISATYNSYGSGTIQFDTTLTYFSISELDRQHVAAGRLQTNTAILTTPTVLPWTMTIDTAAIYQGTGVFKVPSGTNAVIVSANVLPAAYISASCSYAIYKNGTQVRWVKPTSTNYWTRSPMTFGIIPVVAGDLLDVRLVADRTGITVSASRGCHVEFECI
jgi:hypothetical protein